MGAHKTTESVAVNQFTADDVSQVLCRRGWLDDAAAGGASPGDLTPALRAWLEDAASLLGPHAPDRRALEDLLALIFHYDTRQIFDDPECHAVLARAGAREVIRGLAHLVLDGPEIDSDRFKEIVDALKARARYRGRELFHPIRLALAGRAGGGEFDRVILLLDRASHLPFRVAVKRARQRLLEFCAALD